MAEQAEKQAIWEALALLAPGSSIENQRGDTIELLVRLERGPTFGSGVN